MRVVQMAFGGHHAKAASNEVQKKLQEEAAMADDADKLAAGMAGMDVKDDDKMSIASSAAAAAAIELLRAQNRQLQGQLNVMAMTTTTLTEQLAETAAAVCPEQMKHNQIIASPFFTGAMGAMQGPDLDIDTLWWVVQWGNEYLARFKRDANPGRKQAHARYKKWTADTRQKQIAGFTASLRARTGDDSFDQE